jgi:hypothetical protein
VPRSIEEILHEKPLETPTAPRPAEYNALQKTIKKKRAEGALKRKEETKRKREGNAAKKAGGKGKGGG